MHVPLEREGIKMKGLGSVVLAVVLVLTSILGFGALAFGDYNVDGGVQSAPAEIASFAEAGAAVAQEVSPQIVCDPWGDLPESCYMVGEPAVAATEETAGIASFAEAGVADVSNLVQICDIDGSCGLIAADLLEPVALEPSAEIAAFEEGTLAEIAAIPEPLQFLSPEGIWMVQLCDPFDSTGTCAVVAASLLEPVVVEAALEEPIAEIAGFEEALAQAMELIATGMCEPTTGECVLAVAETSGESAAATESGEVLVAVEAQMVLYCDPDGTCGLVDAQLLAELGLQPVSEEPLAEVAAIPVAETVSETAVEVAEEMAPEMFAEFQPLY